MVVTLYNETFHSSFFLFHLLCNARPFSPVDHPPRNKTYTSFFHNGNQIMIIKLWMHHEIRAFLIIDRQLNVIIHFFFVIIFIITSVL